jgi:hypothetical protein
VTVYATLQDALNGLLGETVRTLTEVPQPYVVIGGWTPLLRCADPIPHPGTRDVDLLFEHGATEGALREVIEAFLAAGYLRSAKHEFQLFRELRVGPHTYVFSVDILHPTEKDFRIGDSLFTKHMDHGVPVSPNAIDLSSARSLATPDAALIFEHGLHSTFEFSTQLPSGDTVEVAVPLMSEAGLLVTKANSVRKPKRERDAFDIAIAVAQPSDVDRLYNEVASLPPNRDEEHRLAPIGHELEEPRGGGTFEQRVDLYLTGNETSAASLVQGLATFLKEVGAIE